MLIHNSITFATFNTDNYCLDKDTEVCAIHHNSVYDKPCILAIYTSILGNFSTFLINFDLNLHNFLISNRILLYVGTLILITLRRVIKNQFDNILHSLNLSSIVNFPTRRGSHDRARATPIDEMLQQFCGVEYMTSLDLASAVLQIQLDKSSKKYTAFLFETNVYPFQRVPFGTKNSLAVFVRGLKKVLEGDVSSFCACYLDDIVIYSKIFEEHLGHMNLIFSKPTTAGFTINALKC
jgi:hypothetical protein